jgi:hypothetical protein
MEVSSPSYSTGWGGPVWQGRPCGCLWSIWHHHESLSPYSILVISSSTSAKQRPETMKLGELMGRTEEK